MVTPFQMAQILFSLCPSYRHIQLRCSGLLGFFLYLGMRVEERAHANQKGF